MGPGTTPDGYSIDESGAWIQDGTHIVCDAGGQEPIVFDVQNPGSYDPNGGIPMTMWNTNDGSPISLVVARTENPADSGEGATMYCVNVSISEGGNWSLFYSNDL